MFYISLKFCPTLKIISLVYVFIVQIYTSTVFVHVSFFILFFVFLEDEVRE